MGGIVLKKEYAAYLFVTFTGESEDGEQVYFSVSRDGLHWRDLNCGKPVLTSSIGEKGARDPFIIRSCIDNKFYIIATDLRIANGKGWETAVNNGSKSLIVWESDDLIHWSKEVKVDVGVEGAGCVWAPEAIYDHTKDAYFVFWASMVKGDGESTPRHKIYSSYTRDFKNFSKAEKYIVRDNDVIDTTIIEDNGIFYRFSKDETEKNIRVDKGSTLNSASFTKMSAPKVEELMGVEGPAIFKFNDREEWCLMLDQYAAKKGYLPLVTSNLSEGNYRILEPSEYDMGQNKKRHGSILNITEEEYNNLNKHFTLSFSLPLCYNKRCL